MPQTKRPLKVFLCHAHADRDPVRALYTRLTNDGVDAWLDKEKLLPGQDWELEIKKAVREADVVVVCLSKQFVQAGVKHKEVKCALDTAMEKPEGEIFIIPARLEECDNLESLRKWHWVDLFTENGYSQLLSAFGQFSKQSSHTQKIKLEDDLQLDNGIETQHSVSLRIEGYIEDSTVIIGNNNTITKKSERIRFFVTLSEYLDRPTSEFPKNVDFDNGLVYFPSDYFEKINSVILEKDKCLLLGNSAAGKTVLAIAFGKMLQDEQGFIVQYGNASRALDGDGRLWYHHVMENDIEKTIFIIDNCHLAVDEVNEFCFQIDANAPKFTKIILISRPPAKGKRDSSAMIGDFYDLFFDTVIDVQPQKIYRGVLDQFESYCLQLNPSYYVPLKYDKAEVLEQQHSFSLITSKSRLNAWRETGGKLSEVTNELTYKLLSDKYLSKAEVSLIALCGLWQFEIPIHSTYVDNILSQEDINYLLSINLIFYEIIPNYGKNYYLLLHPGEAKEIFETHIFLQWGVVNKVLVLREIEEHLFEYLVESPQNYQSVYDALFRYGHKNLEQTFLIKEDLQKAAAKRFLGGRLSDVSRYLFALSKIDPDLAKNMLVDFIDHYDLVNFRKRLVDQNIHNFQFSIFHFYRVDNDFIRKVVIDFDPQYLANKIQDDSFYNLSWLVRTLARISPEKTTDTLNYIPLENLVSMAIRSNIRDIERFINHCIRFNVWNNRLNQFGDLLSKKTNMFSTYDIKDLQVLHDILRVLRKVSPSLAENYRSNFYFDMQIDDIVNLLDRSTLSQVAYNLEKSRYLWGEGYKIFVENYLPGKLGKSELGEINKFLLAIKDKDEKNFYFVVENLNTFLLKGELKEKLVVSNISDFAVFVEITSGGLDFDSIRDCCRIINSQNRTSEMLVVSLENLVHILWNIIHIGEIDRLTLVDDSFLISRIVSSWEINVVWSLELLGICMLVDTNYRNYLMNVKLSEGDKLMLMRWLTYAVNHKLLFPFLLVVKGLREVAPDIAEDAFLFLINKSDSVSWVDDSFDVAFTRYSQKIMRESRSWFSDLLFRDTISSIDKLAAKVNDLINNPSI